MSPYAVYAALLGLTAVTVAASFQDLGGLNLPAALAIAGAKGALVTLFFMRLRHESSVVRLWAAAGVLWLLLLLTLAMADYATRDVEPPGRAGASGESR